MAKYFGKIGFAEAKKVNGVVTETYIEHEYYGDLNRNTRRLQGGDKVNDDIEIANEISIVADPYAVQNFHSMRYATYMDTKWKITSVEAQLPRLILTLGGVYNAR